MNIYLPEKLDAKNVLQFCLDISKKDLSKARKINFEMNCNWVDPLGMLLCRSAILSLKSRYPDAKMTIYPYDTDSIGYAAHMGFFKSLSDKVTFGKAPGEASGSENYVPITILNLEEMHRKEIEKGEYIDVQDMIEKEASKLSTIICRKKNKIYCLLTYILREIFRNIPEHSETNTVIFCGQFWRNRKATIVVLDEGIGIKNSLIKNKIHREYIFNDKDALEVCIKPGVSRSFSPDQKNKSNDIWSNSGFGLYVISELCNKLGGEFYLISGRNYLSVKNGKQIIGDTMYKGTAICVSIDTDNLNNTETLITEIVRRGEEIARKNRNAFANASIPSKKLFINE